MLIPSALSLRKASQWTASNTSRGSWCFGQGAHFCRGSSGLKAPLGHKWRFPKMVLPQNGWFIMENFIKIADLGVPLFWETPKWWLGRGTKSQSGFKPGFCGCGINNPELNMPEWDSQQSTALAKNLWHLWCQEGRERLFLHKFLWRMWALRASPAG